MCVSICYICDTSAIHLRYICVIPQPLISLSLSVFHSLYFRLVRETWFSQKM